MSICDMTLSEAIRDFFRAEAVLIELAKRDDVSEDDLNGFELERDGWAYRCIVAWSKSTDPGERVEAERACPAVKAIADLARGKDARGARSKGIDASRVRDRRSERGDSFVTRDSDSVAEFIGGCELLVAEARELPERFEVFAASVAEKAEGMAAWAEENECFTPAMGLALSNMRDGVERCQR